MKLHRNKVKKDNKKVKKTKVQVFYACSCQDCSSDQCVNVDW